MHSSKPATIPHKYYVPLCITLLMLYLLGPGCTLDPLKQTSVDLDSQPLRITEVQSANKTTLKDFQGDYSDWFEILNRSGSTLDLSGYTVSNKLSNLSRWTFPAVSIEPGERLLIFASGKNYRNPAYELHTDFSLSSSGDQLYICDSTGKLIDQTEFGASIDDQSWIRMDDGTEELTGFPSPGDDNIPGGSEVNFSLPAGIYSGRTYPEGLSITLAGSGTIRYTIDGTTPDETSPVWDGTPIHIAVPPQAEPSVSGGATTVEAADLPALRATLRSSLPKGLVISARCWVAGRPGTLVRNTYIVHNGELADDTPLAIVSLSGNPDDLSETGLFDPNRLYDGSEYRVHLEYFDQSHTLALEQDAGITLFGAYSRNFPLKSMALHARSTYGTSHFSHDFFGLRNDQNGPIEEYDDLVLRNSGNDWDSTLLRDALMTSLLEGTGQDYQAYRPVAVYLNGTYQGFYSLREKINEDFIYSHHPSSEGKILDLVANWGEVLSGNYNSMSNFMAWIEAADLTQPSQYTQLKTMMDIPNFIDYQIANIYYANTDWPGNNTKCWRVSDTGAWRWMVYDTDFGMGLINSVIHNTLAFALDPSGTAWNSPNATLLFRKLMTNSEFSSLFFARLEVLLQSNFATDKVLARIAEYRAQAEDEILHRHMRQWATEMYYWDNIENGTFIARYFSASPLDQNYYADRWNQNVAVLNDFATQRPGWMRIFAESRQDTTAPVRGTGTGLNAAYYDNAEYSGDPVATRVDSTINFSCPGSTTPVDTLNTDRWSAIWTGWLESSFDGTVIFNLNGDDNGDVRLDLNNDGDFEDDGETVVTLSWAYQNPLALYPLQTGVRYPIQVRIRDTGGDGSINLKWSRGTIDEVIPQSQFYSSN